MKKYIKKAILWFNATFLSDMSGKVIYYHDVGEYNTRMGTPVDLFKEHVRIAKDNGFRFVSKLDDLSEDKTLLICFDDGFHGIYENKDYFVTEGLRPIVFIAVDLVGRKGYLSWDEIQELQRLGFVFESHTWTHQTLSGAYIDESPVEDRTDSWFLRELKLSREEISEHIGRDVRSLCFPAGHFSRDVLDRCEIAGYQRVYTSVPGSTLCPVQIKSITQGVSIVPRNLCQSCSGREFLWIICGALSQAQGYFLKLHQSKS